MKRGPKKDAIRGRSPDPIKDGNAQEVRRALRGMLQQLVEQFGYSEIRKALLAAKDAQTDIVQKNIARAIDKAFEGAAADVETAMSPDIEKARAKAKKFARLQQVWLCVERVKRSESSPLTDEKACQKIASAGGIYEMISGGHLGVPRIAWHISNASTIEREYRRAEKLKKSGGEDGYTNPGPAWEKLLADMLAAERSAPKANQGEYPIVFPTGTLARS